MTPKIEVKGTWNEQKARLLNKFSALTDNDLKFEFGKKEEMLANHQVKLGKSKEELHEIMEAI
jgi:uncharacterized protein YjbJ (UPF0337 family)